MKKDEEYSYVRFFDGDTADGSENVISIEATKEDSYTYRKSLIAFGVDLEAYAEDVYKRQVYECGMQNRSAGNCKTIWSLCGAGF